MAELTELERRQAIHIQELENRINEKALALSTVKAMLRNLQAYPGEILEIMGRENIVLNDMSNPIQKLCMTAYAKLVSCAEYARLFLEENP